MKVIKHYEILTMSLKTQRQLDLETDRAVATFRGFACVGHQHISNVHNQLALNVMLGAIEDLHEALLAQKSLIDKQRENVVNL